MKEDFRRDGADAQARRNGRGDSDSPRHSDYHDDDFDGYSDAHGSGPYRDEIFSKRVPAGKRTYFFDVKTTRSGRDYFLTITESKRIDEHRYEKHKIFLYKEDFGKFMSAMCEAVRFIQDECLPGYEFRGLPDVSAIDGELDKAQTGDGDSY
jgi:hypothetical protein